MKTPLSIFYSYAQSEQDEVLLHQLEAHLQVLEQTGRIAGWHRHMILAGQERANVIDEHINAAQIILLLISPDFLSSPYCYGVEMKRALERHRLGEARVIPLLLRPVFYEGAPFEQLAMLPANGKAITSWEQRDEAFADIAKGLHHVLQELDSPVPAPKSDTDATHVTHFHGPAQGIVIGESNTVTTHFSGAPQTQQQAAPIQQTQRCDVLLVTATLVEIQAVLQVCQDALQHTWQRRFINDKTYYDLGSIGGAAVFLVQTEMGSGGPGGSLLTVQEGISVLSPSAVIMVGIAFGMNPKKQKLGDILLSRQLFGYDLQRLGTEPDGSLTIRGRGDRPQATIRLLDRFRSALLDWQGASVHTGLLLSGEKLVDHPGFRAQLQALEPEALGGEMEGAGLYAAAQRKNVAWIVVKAICDWGDGKKSVRQQEERQQRAASNAALFVLHALQQGGFAS